MNTAEKIQREIRRRAFVRADLHEQQAAGQQYTRYTIDALEEVTGLPRLELETIANEVRASFGTGEKEFFSIKNQIFMVGSALIPLFILIWLIATLI